MLNKLTGQSVEMKINFMQYKSSEGDSHSGAYLFIPNGVAEVSEISPGYIIIIMVIYTWLFSVGQDLLAI